MEDGQNKHEISANETKLKQTGKVSYRFYVSRFVLCCLLTQDNNRAVLALLCVPASIHEEPSSFYSFWLSVIHVLVRFG